MWVCGAANERGIAKWAIFRALDSYYDGLCFGCYIRGLALGGSLGWIFGKNPSSPRNANGKIIGPLVILWMLLGRHGRYEKALDLPHSYMRQGAYPRV